MFFPEIKSCKRRKGKKLGACNFDGRGKKANKRRNRRHPISTLPISQCPWDGSECAARHWGFSAQVIWGTSVHLALSFGSFLRAIQLASWRAGGSLMPPPHHAYTNSQHWTWGRQRRRGLCQLYLWQKPAPGCLTASLWWLVCNNCVAL